VVGFDAVDDLGSARIIGGRTAQSDKSSFTELLKVVGFVLVASGGASLLFFGLRRKQGDASTSLDTAENGRQSTRKARSKPSKPTRKDRKSGARYATLHQDDGSSCSQSDDEFKDVS
jgi:hypothetical protein